MIRKGYIDNHVFEEMLFNLDLAMLFFEVIGCSFSSVIFLKVNITINQTLYMYLYGK